MLIHVEKDFGPLYINASSNVSIYFPSFLLTMPKKKKKKRKIETKKKQRKNNEPFFLKIWQNTSTY